MKALMVVGTSSYAGKSLITAALCRIFHNKGYHVTPFKAQNMSLNSGVTSDGREISRAQLTQARAAKVPSETDMNPILLKPKGDGHSQVVLFGRPWGDISARDYYDQFVEEVGRKAVTEALHRLSSRFDMIIMEGAGSPVEINLYKRDIANFGAAEIAGAEVILVADIERGGMFASIYGTIMLLSDAHRSMVKGIIVNKFRGDKDLLDPGLSEIEELTGVPVLGVVPYINDLMLPEEDSQGLPNSNEKLVKDIKIAVIRLPRISNFTDFDPLLHDERVDLSYVSIPHELKNAHALILPGTKSTLEDLLWLRETGLDQTIMRLQGRIPIIGICGGYQILGKRIIEEAGNGEENIYEGLGLLDVETRFKGYEKKTMPVKGVVHCSRGFLKGLKGQDIKGYEIHMGMTSQLKKAATPFIVDGEPEGSFDEIFMTLGTYLHDLFDNPELKEAFIDHVMKGNNPLKSKEPKDDVDPFEEDIERLAGIVEDKIDLTRFL